ncbi:hypothetical protein [Micromonospora robiginosa]|uniref:Flavin reductase n=1 Tax=Micromonospora robiginosa TaxID=2749844 RepID=A0A7L6BCE1_9ACTN|nr:hypothetical protein [Micromonospora ferruginea]QLQ39616.1 hypothetical protein H1D33_12765 [Micromonospora ferruginea]
MVREQSVPGRVEHLPMRPLWLCRRCGQPWPCGAAKVTLVADYRDSPVNLFLYLAGHLHEAIDDLHRLNPSLTGSAADMFDRFLGWPARRVHAYRIPRPGSAVGGGESQDCG